MCIVYTEKISYQYSWLKTMNNSCILRIFAPRIIYFFSVICTSIYSSDITILIFLFENEKYYFEKNIWTWHYLLKLTIQYFQIKNMMFQCARRYRNGQYMHIDFCLILDLSHISTQLSIKNFLSLSLYGRAIHFHA